MKKLYTLSLAALAFTIVLSSCKKKKDDETTPALFSQSVTTSAGITIDMTWTTGSHTDGEAYIDLDILADDTSMAGGYEFNSSNSSGTESFSIANGDPNGTYFLGALFYDYETGTTSGDAVYTLKIYPTGNSASPITVTGTMPASYKGNAKSYNKYKLVKSGTSYTVQEVSPILVLSNGY